MASRKQTQREVLESVYSVITPVFVLVACVELPAAASYVDVYRLIQYDIYGVLFASRLAQQDQTHQHPSPGDSILLDTQPRLGDDAHN